MIAGDCGILVRVPVMEEVRIRRSRRVAAVAATVGVGGLALTLAVDFVRTPLTTALCAVAVVVGVLGMIDRRVKLLLSEDGVRYSEWGSSVIPWLEFSGFRWAAWRGQPYLQLLPRRPSQLVADFSKVGRINHRSRELLRMPRFGIAVSALEVTAPRLAELVARYLPELPAS